MSRYTPEELLRVAEAVEPFDDDNEWKISTTGSLKGHVYACVESLCWTYEPLNMELTSGGVQQLRLRDWLADQGVVIVLDGKYMASRMMADGSIEHVVKEDGDPLYKSVARHKDINTCCLLAAIALTGE
jgi:hypothetical protein